MDLHERLNIFLARLNAASPCGTGQEALALVCRLIEEVEEEFCRITRVHPPPLVFTGRMYAPQSDHVRVREDGTMVATTRQHRIFCRPDGSITIVHIPRKTVVLNKPGKQQ